MPSRTIRTANGFSGACGVDLPALRRALNAYLDESIERQRRESDREPEQTTAFRRVLQTAILHVQSAQRSEANVGDILAAILQQPKSYAAQLLADQGVTRLDVLELHLARHREGAGGECRRRSPLRPPAPLKRRDRRPLPTRCPPTA